MLPCQVGMDLPVERSFRGLYNTDGIGPSSFLFTVSVFMHMKLGALHLVVLLLSLTLHVQAQCILNDDNLDLNPLYSLTGLDLDGLEPGCTDITINSTRNIALDTLQDLTNVVLETLTVVTNGSIAISDSTLSLGRFHRQITPRS